MSSRFNQQTEFQQIQDDDIPIMQTSSQSEQPLSNKQLTRKESEIVVIAGDSPADDDAPGYFSWNPIDWYKDLKKEFDEFTWVLDEKKRVLLRAVFGEGLVTFLFLFTVEATAVNNGRQESPENLVLGALSTALCAVALIYSFADVSGAHFNPAVTFAVIVTGKTSLMYIGIQLLASILATSFLMAVFPRPHDGTFSSIPSSVVLDIDPTASVANAFFMEFILTFVLVYVIFAVAFDTVDTSNNVKEAGAVLGKTKDNEAGKKLTIYTTSGNTKAGFAPLSIGFTLGFLGLIGGSVSGGAFNPARVFGPAVLTGNFHNNWIYWVGDFLGAALAGWTQHLFSHEMMLADSEQVPVMASVRGASTQVATVELKLLRSRVPYFEAHSRFHGMTSSAGAGTRQEVNLLEHCDPSLAESLQADDAEKVWAEIGSLFAECVSSKTSPKDQVVRLGSEWISRTKPKSRKTASGRGESSVPSAIPTVVKKQIPNNMRGSPKTEQRIQTHHEIRSADLNQSKQAEGDDAVAFDFRDFWLLALSIADFLMFDTMKESLLKGLYSLGHNFKCSCGRCLGPTGLILRFANMVDSSGIDYLVDDCVHALCLSWHKTYAHALYPKINMKMRKAMTNRVVEMINTNNAFVSMSRLLSLKSRVFYDRNDSTFLQAVEKRIMELLHLASPDPQDRPAKTGNVRRKASHVGVSQALSKCWEEDNILRDWAIREVVGMADANGLKSAHVGHQNDFASEIDGLTPAVEEIFRLVTVNLSTENVVPIMGVLERILCQAEKWAVANRNGQGRDDGEYVHAIIGGALTRCVDYVSKRWINIELTEQTLSPKLAKRVCESIDSGKGPEVHGIENTADLDFAVDIRALLQTPAQIPRQPDASLDMVGISSQAAGYITPVPHLVEELNKSKGWGQICCVQRRDPSSEL
ncbi:hypothetical protein HDU82_000882 [Entophlyctis luteolus]|nr:hypothetical protein HDU82_000882 [Entophlyctis luteolus]